MEEKGVDRVREYLLYRVDQIASCSRRSRASAEALRHTQEILRLEMRSSVGSTYCSTQPSTTSTAASGAEPTGGTRNI